MDSVHDLLNLSGKVAIVTGGASGIGWEICQRLAEAGAQVALVDQDERKAFNASQELISKGYQVKALRADVSSEPEVLQMVSAVMSTFGQIDILVNNAGIYPNVPLLSSHTSLFDRVLGVNLRGAYLCTKYVASQMAQRNLGGKIINITSVDALHPSLTGLSAYDASKHGLWGLTKTSALELSKYRIRVNAIAPGGILTPGIQTNQGVDPTAVPIDSQQQMNQFIAKIPMHRMGQPDEIAKVALFLASEMSSYMTGAQIVVDGGVLLA